MDRILFILLFLSITTYSSAQRNIHGAFKSYFKQNQEKYTSEKFKEKAIEHLKQDAYDDAAIFIKLAYILQSDSIKKAEYYYYSAVTEFARENYQGSRELALTAARYNPNYCKPYVLIAKLYVQNASICFDDYEERRTVYWAAVDKLEKAKSVDNSCDEEVDKLIEKFKKRFPGPSCIFGRLYEGGEYTVGCWINEVTTIRYKE
jgi:tetratricopeptide (TPR) repeat protein